MRPQPVLRHFGIIVLLISATISAQDDTTKAKSIDFQRLVLPILQDRCVDCHNERLNMADLRLDSREAMIESGVLEPGAADKSLLVRRLHERELGILMPPTGLLSKSEIEILTAWINAGAEWPAGLTVDTTRQNLALDARAQALFTVIRNDDFKAVSEMLRDEGLIEARNQYGATPLMHAALYARAESVERLLTLGADVNARDNEGMTALMFAVADVRKVRMLIDKGADVHKQSKLGRNALLLASAYAGNSPVVEALLNQGADIQYADKRGWTAVVLAARTGDSDLVRRLLDAGGTVNGGNAEQLSPGTPLMQAAWAGDVKTAQLLLERGAASNQRSLDTALIFAATHGNSALTKLLLAAGADPLTRVATNYVPESPLLAAAYSDCLDTENVSLLLERGADPTAKDARGETSLSLATQRGSTEVLRLLQSAAKAKPGGSKAAEPTLLQPAVLAQEDQSALEPDLNKIRHLVQKSIRLLQSCGPQFYAKSGCVACHQQSTASLAVNMASKKGLTVDDQLERQQVKLTAVDLGLKRVAWLQRIKVGGTTHRIGYLLWGLSEANYTPDEITDAAYFELAGLQLANGSWVSDAHRPPTEYSPVTATAVAMRGLQRFAPPGQETISQQRVQNATRWLINAKASANAERSFRLLGLHWGNADPNEISAATNALLQDQNSNGGWSQLPALEPDAYATGLTLLALHQAGGLAVTDARYRQGVKFLLDTSHDDGAWHVKSRSFAFQPYFESGFPFEHDQWISAAATGWASMALMQMIEQDNSR